MFTHQFEEFIKKLQSGEVRASSQAVSIVLKGIDTIKMLVEELKTGEYAHSDVAELTQFINVENKSDYSTKQKTTTVDRTAASPKMKASEIKVGVDLLDEFLQVSGEMTVVRNMINRTVKNLEKQYRGDKDVAMLSDLLEELHKMNSNTQNKITELRKVPVKHVLKPMARIVRDVSGQLKKSVNLALDGEELRVDTSIAEVLSVTLVHLLRNSLDHGIEDAATRKQASKSEAGTIRISCRTQGENIYISIADDGKGIDPKVIKSKAIEKGIRRESDFASMSKSDIFALIFEAGFSTAQQVTDISGRGVGMSMVLDSVKGIGGQIHIDSEVGKGSVLTLELPIPKSVLITNCLFVGAHGYEVAIPQDSVQRIIKVHDENRKSLIRTLQGGKLVTSEGVFYPLVKLSHVLGLVDGSEVDGDYDVVIVTTPQKVTYGLVVDEVFDLEDVVVKPLAKAVKSLGVYSGGTFVGEGSVGLILDLDGIAEKQNVKSKLKSVETADKVLAHDVEEGEALLVVRLAQPGYFALRLDEVFRIERFQNSEIHRASFTSVVKYRESLATLINLDAHIKGEHTWSISEEQGPGARDCIVVSRGAKYFAFVVNEIVDFERSAAEPQKIPNQHPDFDGAVIIRNKTV